MDLLFEHLNGWFKHFNGRSEHFHRSTDGLNRDTSLFLILNACYFRTLQRTMLCLDYLLLLPLAVPPSLGIARPGRFFLSFLSFPCHSSFSLFLYLLLFLSPSPRLPLPLPLSFLLSFPLSVSLWPSLFPLLNSLSVIRRVELSVCPPDNVGQSQAVLRSN